MTNILFTHYEDLDHLSVAQVARVLDISRNTVFRWEQIGKLPKATRSGKLNARQFKREDIAKLIKPSV